MKYYIWTQGCQMNVADSQRVASTLEALGYKHTKKVDDANVIILNTCMVRQSAENKAYNRLMQLRQIKMKRPDITINLMGCMVGIKNHSKIREKFPFVDVFSPPSDVMPLVNHLLDNDGKLYENQQLYKRFQHMDGELKLPDYEQDNLVTAYIPVVYGCSHACTYCIIPYKRGGEVSRSPDVIYQETLSLIDQGVKEITLLGQIVDRYGRDKPGYPSLSGLIGRLQNIDGLERIRFLTSHPKWMTDDLLDCMAENPKVMPHVEVPAQSGDNEVLARMRRGYSSDDYRSLIERIRKRIPNVSIATDIIVGFPGESEKQFQHTYDLLAELKLDVAHLARYSAREGTISAKNMSDDVSKEEKLHRFRVLEELQKDIVTQIHSKYLGQNTEVLFEEKKKNRWRGRTPTNKLVFVESDQSLLGKIEHVEITWTGPWSMIGKLYHM